MKNAHNARRILAPLLTVGMLVTGAVVPSLPVASATPAIFSPRPPFPDPVPVRNFRTGFIALPPDARSLTMKVGAFGMLGASCPVCVAADVWGGDVAVSWDDGRGGTFVMFGDTVGYNYLRNARLRSNTLAYTQDPILADGLQLQSFLLGKDGRAKEAIPSLHQDGFERSKIPTGGFSYKGVQYAGWQSVSRLVNDNRKWLTSRSGLSASYDHGKTWHQVFVRPQGKYHQFQQVSYAIKDNYLYEFGTRQGRELGGLGVARVPLSKIDDLSAREYWTGIRWLRNTPQRAFTLITGIRGEISVQYEPWFRRFIMLRGQDGAIVIASSLDGVLWSPGRRIYRPQTSLYSVYSPQMLPNRRGSELYFLLSVWQDYNVTTMFTPAGF